MVGLRGIDTDAGEAQAFDRETFERLYRQWWSDVVALCRGSLGGGGEAEDAAQEAFLRAWLARDRYSPVRPFWPWVATIARRLCIDERRRRLRQELELSATGVAMPEAAEAVVEREVEAGHDLRVAFRLLDELRPLERRVLVGRHVHGLSYREIAGDEELTVEAVRGSLKRARATLRESLVAGLFDLDLCLASRVEQATPQAPAAPPRSARHH